MSGMTTFTDEIEIKANEYIDGAYIDEGQVIPSAMGLAKYIKVAESTVYKWAADGHGTFSETLAKCQSEQHLVLINKGLSGEFNATVTKLALANHGHSEKTSTDITSGGKAIKNEWHIHPVSTDK